MTIKIILFTFLTFSASRNYCQDIRYTIPETCDSLCKNSDSADLVTIKRESIEYLEKSYKNVFSEKIEIDTAGSELCKDYPKYKKRKISKNNKYLIRPIIKFECKSKKSKILEWLSIPFSILTRSYIPTGGQEISLTFLIYNVNSLSTEKILYVSILDLSSMNTKRLEKIFNEFKNEKIQR